MEKDDDQIILQGYEIGLGWTLAIDRVTGNMRITFAGWKCCFHYLRGLYVKSIERERCRNNVCERLKYGIYVVYNNDLER